MQSGSSSIAMAVVTLCALVGVLAGGCSSEKPPMASGDGTGSAPPIGNVCAHPYEGCACDQEGATADCGTVHQVVGSYVECSMGKRTCNGGHWSTCNGDLIVTKQLPPSSLHFDGLGTPSSCSWNPCAPYCSSVTDTPDGIDPGPGFKATGGGLTLSGGGKSGATCTGLTITPGSATVTVTSLTSAPQLAFDAHFTPNNCVPDHTQPTWTVTRTDLATIDATGNLTVFGAVAGNNLMNVQAFFGSLSSNIAPVSVLVKIPTTSTTDVSPNTPAPGGQRDKFYAGANDAPPDTCGGVPCPSDVTWLYPYASTYFPLGMLPPTVMYLMGANPGNTVRLTLRYPSGSTASTSLFNYELVVKEANTVSATVSMMPAGASKDPQIVIPTAAWRAFEQTAKGQDADIVLQRWDSSHLQVESARTIHFVNEHLKGTVYYNSYSSPLAGNTGAVLAIQPKASTPTVAVQPGGKCTVCHTLSVDGRMLIVNGPGSTYPSNFNSSKRYDVSLPGPPVVNTYAFSNSPGGGQDHDVAGDKFTYGAPRTDGSLYMTHGGGTGGNVGWRTPPSASRLYDPNDPNNPKTVSGWSNVQAVTPRFSPDGSKLAFGYWAAGTALNQSPSGTLAADSTGRTLAVVDFNVGPGPSYSVSNVRNLTPGVSHRVAWPSFLPGGGAVVWQRQYRSSKALLAWDPSDLDTVAGALSELWISNVTANTGASSTPTELRALNGLNAGGSSYLPTVARTLSPTPTSYHTPNASFMIRQADNCGNTATATNVNDYQLNYLPSANPSTDSSSPVVWVVFTSRRMYGNIAFDNPWDAEPDQPCYSHVPPTKKLWVAAIDKSFTPGTDPSHPAFYLPGQELTAGNSNGYWVDALCGGVGSSCDTDADCCGGEVCRISTSPAPPPVVRTCQLASSCVAAGGACSADADCCGNPTVKCLGSVCATPGKLAAATFSRVYTATCSPGFSPVWQTFQWQAIIPNSAAAIDFSAQTGDTATSLGPAVSIGSAATTISPPSWGTGPQTIDEALRAAVPMQTSKGTLQINMGFNTDGSVAGTLTNWRVTYDCMPAQ